VLQALDLTAQWVVLARARFGLPVVLMGSSLGGLPCWTGLRDARCVTVPGAGHRLFHDDLERTWPLLAPVLEQTPGLRRPAP
jgi:hypothetical protein